MQEARTDLTQYITAGVDYVGFGFRFLPVMFIDPLQYYGKKEDAPPERPHQYGYWCHLWTDDGYENDLTAFAGRIGLRADFGQYGGSIQKYHFDLRPSKRKLALAAGAVERGLEDWIESCTALQPPHALALPLSENVYSFARPVEQRTVLKVLRGAVYAVADNGISLMETLIAPARRDYHIARFENEPLLVTTWREDTVIEVTQRAGSDHG